MNIHYKEFQDETDRSATASQILHPDDESRSEPYPVFTRRSSFHRLDENLRPVISEFEPLDAATRNDILRRYEDRLESFRNNWPSWCPISIYTISKCGMRYKGPDDKVQCDYCRGILYSWDHGDNPLEEHKTHFPLCHFLTNKWYEILQDLPENQTSNSDTDSGAKNLPQSTGYDYSDNTGSTLNTNFQTPGTIEQQIANSQTGESKVNIAKTIVKEIGYSEDHIQRAIDILSANTSRIDTQNLLDTIHRIEDSEAVDFDLLKERFMQNVQVKHASKPGINLPKKHANQELLQEHSKLKQNSTCNVCWKEKSCILFLPCRHILACTSCANDMKTCLKCSEIIIATVKVY